MPFSNFIEQESLISHSWKRCHNLGLSPTNVINDAVLVGKDLQELIKENEYWIKHSIFILEKLYPTIQSSGHVVVIAEQNGTVVHKLGKLDIDDSLACMLIGSNWSEEIKGTNAIGLALYAKKPIIIHAEQHFYVENHYLTCAASPIYSPADSLIGTINISARKELFHPFMISLVRMVAESVQNRLLLEQLNHENLLILKETEYIANSSSSPLLTLDSNNIILRANQLARTFLGNDCIGREFRANQKYLMEKISDGTDVNIRSIVSFNKASKPNEKNLYQSTDMIGSCKKMIKVKSLVKKAALYDYPVIIYGESGTGKELVAQSLHAAGPRAMQPFIAVNCSAIPEGLIESELFGYEKGAFTGANRDGAPGKFEMADGGTIFLDEIGDMPLKAQAALLRVLQEKKLLVLGQRKKNRSI